MRESGHCYSFLVSMAGKKASLGGAILEPQTLSPVHRVSKGDLLKPKPQAQVEALSQPLGTPLQLAGICCIDRGDNLETGFWSHYFESC
jgi:hypothetical protein